MEFRLRSPRQNRRAKTCLVRRYAHPVFRHRLAAAWRGKCPPSESVPQRRASRTSLRPRMAAADEQKFPYTRALRPAEAGQEWQLDFARLSDIQFSSLLKMP